MLHSPTEKWPFTLQLRYDSANDVIKDVVYVNLTSKTKLNLRVVDYQGYSIKLRGYDGQKDFTISFEAGDPYTGESWWGNHRESIELFPVQ